MPRDSMYAAVVHFMNSIQKPTLTLSEIATTIAITIDEITHQTHSALPGIGIRAPAGH
jgi:hypothetical protein